MQHQWVLWLGQAARPVPLLHQEPEGLLLGKEN